VQVVAACWTAAAARASVVFAALALGLAVTVSPAAACSVCIDLPDDTLTDRIWDADTVALGRSDPANPFAYRIVETLSGGTEVPVGYLVNSIERRRMASDPEHVTLLLHGSDGWRIDGHGGAELVALARQILAQEATWGDEAIDPDRIAAFVARQAHSDPAIRRLALAELARAPYALLRGIEVTLDPDWLAAMTTDATWYAWQPILVQLMGLHTDPAAHALVRANALSAQPTDSVPWLIALIEIDGAAGIARILAENPEGEAASAAAAALVAHADPEHEHALAVGAALRQLALSDPRVAAECIPGLRALGETSVAPDIERMLAEGRVADPRGAFALRSYIAAARRTAEARP
jgi:hypothetical protein